MSKKSFIDSVEVKNACTEDWEKMHGNDRVRFCDHCAKDVKNLSAVTRKEAMRMVRASGGSLCIRYIQNPVTQRPMFADQLFQITRRAPGFAAGVMSASLSLSTLTFAQGGVAVPDISIVTAEKTKQIASAEPDELKPMPSITGTITDQVGAVIQNAKVSIISVRANRNETTTTDGDGVYRFNKVEPATYRVEIEAAGFKTTVTEVSVSDTIETVADASLGIEIVASVEVINNEPMETTISGGIGFVEYSLPLSRAVANDDIDESRQLIINGADVNGKDENYSKITPLSIAVEHGNLEMVQLLLDFGAKINARDKQKQTPLMRLDEDATPELVELLVKYGAKVHLTDSENNTALKLAADYAKPEVLRALIDAGAEIDAANKDGETALMIAAQNDCLENVRILVTAGAKVNGKDTEGETAWDKASDEEVRTLLVTFGAEVKGDDTEEEDSNPTDNLR